MERSRRLYLRIHLGVARLFPRLGVKLGPDGRYFLWRGFDFVFTNIKKLQRMKLKDFSRDLTNTTFAQAKRF